MTVDELYLLAEDYGAQTYSADLPNTGALAISISGVHAIGIDRRLIANERELLPLAHELAHIVTDAFYDPAFSNVNIKRMEHRATKQVVAWLLPEEDLRNALHEDVTLWELAQEFDVPPELIKRAFWIYWRKEVL